MELGKHLANLVCKYVFKARLVLVKPPLHRSIFPTSTYFSPFSLTELVNKSGHEKNWRPSATMATIRPGSLFALDKFKIWQIVLGFEMREILSERKVCILPRQDENCSSLLAIPPRTRCGTISLQFDDRHTAVQFAVFIIKNPSQTALCPNVRVHLAFVCLEIQSFKAKVDSTKSSLQKTNKALHAEDQDRFNWHSGGSDGHTGIVVLSLKSVCCLVKLNTWAPHLVFNCTRSYCCGKTRKWNSSCGYYCVVLDLTGSVPWFCWTVSHFLSCSFRRWHELVQVCDSFDFSSHKIQFVVFDHQGNTNSICRNMYFHRTVCEKWPESGGQLCVMKRRWETWKSSTGVSKCEAQRFGNLRMSVSSV